jgi:putative acetyltransferase
LLIEHRRRLRACGLWSAPPSGRLCAIDPWADRALAGSDLGLCGVGSVPVCERQMMSPTVSTFSIVEFRPEHVSAWKSLNEAWLAEGGFAVEAKDRAVIDDPQAVILAAGGRIFMVEDGERAIGCCALIPMTDGGFEVAKMAVSPQARGQGLGRRLLEACETAAREAGANRLYLETSSTLKPAGKLYRSFGFVDLPPHPSPYVRADVWMEKRLDRDERI